MASVPPVPQLNDAHQSAGYGAGPTNVTDFAQGNPTMSSPLGQSLQQQSGAFHEDFDNSLRASMVDDGGVNRSISRASQSTTAVGAGTVSRNNTLKKRNSVKRTGSLKRSSSKRSLQAGSLKGLGGDAEDNPDFNNVFVTPVPTTGTPTEILANRFQAWRQLLKSLITYFREIQNSYDMRAKALHKVQNTIANITHPSVFMSENGVADASRILEDYHKRSISEANKSREIENDVIGALTGLRSDLGQKIKEIKSLSGDFKNSVEKEKEATRREIEKLQDALQHADHEDGGASGKNDPLVVRLGVDRAIERQIDEENYLHRAYLNLESSGRELESIVVGEIQKAYNALAGILKREGDDAFHAVERLRTGPIAMPKDLEWYQFVTHDPHFVDPGLPLRRIEDIEYPGKNHASATEIRAGMLERKSKYLKSYTPGWYVLSPTHLHEFKSADKIYSQPPVMSLYLLDQKVGSHSDPGSSSHKFMLKGKNKGHNWVFRAESYDTMMAWFEAIRILTEKTSAERNAFVRKHARSVSGTSERGTVSSDGFEEDEADQTPYSADMTNLAEQNPIEPKPQRPQPGGRFPSDMVLRKTGTMTTTTDGADDTDDDDAAVIAAASALPGSSQRDYGGNDPYRLDGIRPGSSYTDNTANTGVYTLVDDPPAPVSPLEPETIATQQQPIVPIQQNIHTQPVQTQTFSLPTDPQQPVNQQQPVSPLQTSDPVYAAPASMAEPVAHNSAYESRDLVAPTAAAAVAGVGAGALGYNAYQQHTQEAVVPQEPEIVATPETIAPVQAEPALVSPVSPASTDALSTSTAATEQAPPAIPLGGNEREGAHETGQIFPRVIRHDTNMSISALHVPGEFPKRD